MNNLQLATVKWQIGCYDGTTHVNCFDSHENEYIIGKAKKRVQREMGAFPFGVESFKVVERRHI